MTRSTGASGLIFFGLLTHGLAMAVAHGGQIDDGGDAGEILHQNTGLDG